jgi:hypothetical protein
MHIKTNISRGSFGVLGLAVLLPPFLTLLIFLLSGCSESLGFTEKSSNNVDAAPVVKEMTVSAPAGGGPYDIYLVKLNSAGRSVPAKNSGIALVSSQTTGEYSEGSYSEMTSSASEQAEILSSPVCYEPEDVQRFNAMPRLSNTFGTSNSLSASASGFSASGTAPAYTVNSSQKEFWVQNRRGEFIKKRAVLRAQGTHCNVWVLEENFSNDGVVANKIRSEDAAGIQAKFDAIYVPETAVLGYEYGGSAPDPAGGVDGDTRVQILVYDIDFDNDSTTLSRTIGYFYSKDEYTQDVLNASHANLKTNLCEMFYIDAEITRTNKELVYSTLVHEFQHMIHFNQKTVRLNMSSAVWYNERLSMITEDMISPKIGIDIGNTGHPVQTRIPLFLSSYTKSGVSDWLPDSSVLYSYSGAFAFGAYLTRNFGGAALVKQIISNDFVDEASISAALNACTANTSNVKDFVSALKRYPEVAFYTSSPVSGKLSFNNTVSSTIGGVVYTFSAIDISNMLQVSLNGSSVGDKRGIAIHNVSRTELRPYGFDIQTCSQWKNKTGTTKIVFEMPTDNSVILTLIAVPVEE